MNKTVQLLIVGFAIVLSSCSNDATNKTPETEMEKVSYSLGVNVATGVKAQGLDTIDANAVAKAFNDVFKGNELDISEEESMEVLQAYFGKLQAAAQAKAGEAGNAYLAENAAKEGPEDKKCVMEARPKNMQPIVVSCHADTIEKSITMGIGKLKTALESRINRS